MMSLALATLIVVLLDRYGAQARSVAAIVRSYENHHTARGVQQILDTWLRSVTPQRIRSKVGEDGLALTVRFPDGLTSNAVGPETLRLYLSDGQGALLVEPGGLPAEDAVLAESIMRAAEGLGLDPARGGVATRRIGPLAVSVVSADERVLRSAVFGAVGAEKGESIVAELLKAREEAALSPTSINEAAGRAGLSSLERADVSRAITVEPVMWRIVVEVSSDSLVAGGPILRYTGTALLVGASTGGGVAASGGATSNSRTIIRDWVREDLR